MRMRAVVCFLGAKREVAVSVTHIHAHRTPEGSNFETRNDGQLKLNVRGRNKKRFVHKTHTDAWTGAEIW